MKQEEYKTLGTLAVIFGAGALLCSRIPIVNGLSFLFGFVALILGVIGIGLNLQNQKTLAMIGSSFGLISIIIVLISQLLFTPIFADFIRGYRSSSNYLMEEPTNEDWPNSTIDEYEEEEEIFTWTQEQFDALIEGDPSNQGQGGSNYKDIISEHGIPDSEVDSSDSDYETKRITYLSLGSPSKAVVLNFVKQKNGQFLLIHKFAVGLDRKEQSDSGVKV
ncbi:hypothetical protein [Streptococcus sp. DTU_2020_1001019_1_SI_AUS_MUR_006]|uniref:hypothetical protein n=1 Tax=Streptococcus TaxID=1301 RepID=UPI0028EA6A67|nr:hypothetical protein [Streptococcus sp. DTU_2020_1001019_1_SI_AUS_MUR_006]WNS73014.1 hypothetical protein RRU92_02920 [Streptococcus sp. DTU_2020_1001019_1_SI_AUS_MUR_006]